MDDDSAYPHSLAVALLLAYTMYVIRWRLRLSIVPPVPPERFIFYGYHYLIGWSFFHNYLSTDLRKGSLRHSRNYYIIDIWKSPKMTKFHMLLYYQENVSIAWCHQSSKCFSYLKFWMLSVALAMIRSEHLQGLIMKSAYKTTKKV